jgi:hypothetical protein
MRVLKVLQGVERIPSMIEANAMLTLRGQEWRVVVGG